MMTMMTMTTIGRQMMMNPPCQAQRSSAHALTDPKLLSTFLLLRQTPWKVTVVIIQDHGQQLLKIEIIMIIMVIMILKTIDYLR